MIAKIQGRVEHIDSNWVIMMVGGVGYRLFVSTPTISALQVEHDASLYVYTHVREDAILLFGFSERDEQELFEILTSVSGIGPRLALAILSRLSVNQIVTAIVHGERNVLTQVTGVGNKTADRLILELKDKLQNWTAPASEATFEHDRSTVGSFHIVDDATTALVGLGYPHDASEAAVAAVLRSQSDATLEEVLRGALKILRTD